MIHFYYRGLGSRYTTYLQEIVRKIARRRRAELGSRMPVHTGHRVAIHYSGEIPTQSRLRELLAYDEVTFIIGDANGIPDSLLLSCNAILMMTPLQGHHKLEAALIIEEIDRILQ